MLLGANFSRLRVATDALSPVVGGPCSILSQNMSPCTHSRAHSYPQQGGSFYLNCLLRCCKTGRRLYIQADGVLHRSCCCEDPVCSLMQGATRRCRHHMASLHVHLMHCRIAARTDVHDSFASSKAGELRGPMELLRLHNPHGGLRLRVFGRDLYHLCWLCAHRHRRGQTLPYNVAGTVLRFLTVLYECGSECQSRVAATSRRTYAIDSNRELVRFGVAGDDGVPSGLVGPLSCIAVGLSHVCLLKESGELLCHSPYGATVPPNLDLGPAVAVTAGFYHTCVLKASGELVCFGSHGPSCNVPPGLGRVIAVAAGQHHTCAVRANGELVCFGGNQRGQCDVPADLGPVSSVAAGLSFTCAVTAHGELVCFGSNSHGQCDVPPDLGPVSAVAAGYVHTCAVKSTGQLVCFGGNDYGQCDVPADLDPVVAVAAGPHHTCAVTDRGMLVCFGDNQFRQCEIPASIRLRV